MPSVPALKSNAVRHIALSPCQVAALRLALRPNLGSISRYLHGNDRSTSPLIVASTLKTLINQPDGRLLSTCVISHLSIPAKLSKSNVDNPTS